MINATTSKANRTNKQNRPLKENLSRTQIRASKRHIEMMDQIADMRCTTRAQLIREAIFQFLLRELKYEANRQDGFKAAKEHLYQLTRGW